MKLVNTKLRSINTKLWDDPFIIECNQSEKLLFLYILTNSLTNLAGVYEIALKRIAFDTCIDIDEVKRIINKFQKDGKIIYSGGFLIIKNFLKNQNSNDSMLKNIEKTLNQLPENIKKIYVEFVKPPDSLYTASIQPVDTLSTACRHPVTSVRQIENESENENEVENKKRVYESKNEKNKDEKFELFWELYNRKVGKNECLRLWGKIKDEDKKKIFETLPAYVNSTPDKQFRKHPATYLRNKSWEDEIVIFHKEEIITNQKNNGFNHNVSFNQSYEIVENLI